MEKQDKRFYVILCCLIVTLIVVCSLLQEKYSYQWLEGIKSILYSAFAAVIISWLFDVPKLVTKMNDSIFDSLINTNHLGNLKKDRLIEMGERINETLHRDSSISSDYFQYLKDLERLAFEPYYDRYSETINCCKRNDNYMKNVEVEYTLKNPTKDTKIINLSIRKYLEFPIGINNLRDVFRIESFEVSIDNSPYYDIKKYLEIHCSDKKSAPEACTYGKSLAVILQSEFDDLLSSKKFNGLGTKKEKDSANTKYMILTEEIAEGKMNAKFKNNVSVKFKYSQVFPKTDCTSTQLLRYITKDFTYRYFCTDPNVKLHGHLVSSKHNQDSVHISQTNSGDFFVSYNEWLLPGNGAYLVMDDVIPDN